MRLASAKLVDHSKNPPREIVFGAVIDAADESGAAHRFAIVGDNEADPPSGKISWNSLLAKKFFGLKAGAEVVWDGAEGHRRLTIKSVSYA